MSAPDLASVLGETYKPGRFGPESGRPVQLCERAPQSVVQVRLWADRAEEGVRSLTARLGKKPPEQPNTAVEAKDGPVMLIGPHRYLAVGPLGADSLESLAGLDPDLGTVVDLTHARTVFRMRGRPTRSALAKGMAVDFHERAFPVNALAGAAVHGVPLLVHRLPDLQGAPAFDVYAPTTFARTVWEWLLESVEEFGGSVVARDGL